MSDSLVELHLNSPAAREASLPHIERLLDLLGDALSDPNESTERQALFARIADYREALHSGSPLRIREAGETLLAACVEALERHKRSRVSMRADIVDLVKLFREVATSVAGEGEATSTDMAESADRFSALAQLTDIRLLKQRLTREVQRLRETAQKREQSWKAVVASFQDKVETLEDQLLATQQEASLDPLTGVANRRLFDRTLRDLTKDSSKRFTLTLIDADDFKRINDEQGHEQGDRALKYIAESFSQSVRANDLVARLGGDEFAVILEGMTLAQATNRMLSVVSNCFAATSNDGRPTVTVSCGVAEFSAGDNPRSLTKRADEALYEAKRQGKGRVVHRAAPLIRDLRRQTDSR
jgi:diguanylate cyclase